MSITNENLGVWELLDRQEVFGAPPYVSLKVDKVKLPSGRIIDDFYRIELPEYAMICAQDDSGKLLLQRQYKHALRKISLAFPSGSIEEGEDPEDGAKREFLEETGYEAQEWRQVGTFTVDGNKGCGKAYFYVAEGLKKVAEPVADETEVSEIVFMSMDETMKAVEEGAIELMASVAFAALATNSRFNQSLKEKT